MKNMKKNAQSLIEYGLILALVAVIAVTVLGKFGKTLSDTADKTNTSVSKASDYATQAYCEGINCGYDEDKGVCDCTETPTKKAPSDS